MYCVKGSMADTLSVQIMSLEGEHVGKMVEQLLKDSGAIIIGHFVGNSGNHLGTYVDKGAITTDTQAVAMLGEMMAHSLKAMDVEGVEVVVAPSVGAVSLGHETAKHLFEMHGRKVAFVFTEKGSILDDRGRPILDKNGKEVIIQVLKRGFDKVVRNKRVFAVEDITTTGGSLKQVIDAIARAGGITVGAAAIVNRDPDKITSKTFGVPFYALLSLKLPSWPESKVPKWLQRIPINTEYGHGKKYKKEHPDAL